MQIVVIANVIPMRDRSAGWFRFHHILRMLASRHEVHFHPVDLESQYKDYGEKDISRYRRELENLGIRVTTGHWADLSKFIRAAVIDIVFFEHYTAAKRVLDEIRFWQPHAKVIIDTIDVAYNRLSSKAKFTKKPDDLKLAQTVKAQELSIYSRSDIVIAISHSDRAVLERGNPDLRVEVIPLIYTMPSLQQATRCPGRDLIFVAHFDHEANVDGIVYFCTDVLPLIQKELPDVRVRIVGHSPPEAVTKLAGPSVEVLGYVPDIRALYASSDVAIAPMRFGGGLKGKIAEAMAYGLPVVTNSVCLEGFDLSAGKDVLVGDNPGEFAHAVVRLLGDVNLYQAIRESGWNYIRSHFSEEVIARMLYDVLDRSQQYPAKKLPMGKWVSWKMRHLLDKHVFWRFRSRGLQGLW
jgi:glycosyltransferase involved in cell wall biosynthesis